MESDEQVDSPFEIIKEGFTAGRAVALPDRILTNPLPIRSVTVYGQRVLVRLSYTDECEVVSAFPLTLAGFREAFPDWIPLEPSALTMSGTVVKGSKIGLVDDDLCAFVTREGGVAHVPVPLFSVSEVSDGYAVLLSSGWNDSRNLYFYNADGTLRWRVSEKPFAAPNICFVEIEIDAMGRLIGKMDWRAGQEFAIDRATGEVIARTKCFVRKDV